MVVSDDRENTTIRDQAAGAEAVEIIYGIPMPRFCSFLVA